MHTQDCPREGEHITGKKKVHRDGRDWERGPGMPCGRAQLHLLGLLRSSAQLSLWPFFLPSEEKAVVAPLTVRSKLQGTWHTLHSITHNRRNSGFALTTVVQQCCTASLTTSQKGLNCSLFFFCHWLVRASGKSSLLESWFPYWWTIFVDVL